MPRFDAPPPDDTAPGELPRDAAPDREPQSPRAAVPDPVPDPVLDAEPSGPVDSVDPGEVPDPFSDADALDELGHEITTLAAHIAAATHRFLVLLADFDRRRGWELGGHRSCAHWLHVATAMDLRTARSRVRVARALVKLPAIRETMSRGELSFSQVRALTRVATPECEAELLDYARSATVSVLERFVRMWRTLSRADEAALERERYRLRRFSVHSDDEGMYVVKGRVTAEVGAALMRAIEAAGDALFSAEAREETTPKQRRADALGLLAERAMAAGFGGEDGSREPSGGAETIRVEVAEDGSREPRGRSDASMDDDHSPPLSGIRAERYQVMLHIKAEGTHLDDGTGLSHETSRRLCCDSAVVRVDRDSDGSVLDVGRRTRTIPPALRRALEVRDGGCRFPGCGLRFTDGHHLIHWSDGGETNLDNLVLLCRFHHRKVHEGGWRVEFWGTERHATFIDPVGGIHIDREWADAGAREASRAELPAPANEGSAVGLPAEPVRALIAGNETNGVKPTGWALWAEHERASDVPWTLQARALEALDAAHFGGVNGASASRPRVSLNGRRPPDRAGRGAGRGPDRVASAAGDRGPPELDLPLSRAR